MDVEQIGLIPSEKECADVISTLIEWGLCSSCVLRFLGDKNQSNYEPSEVKHCLKNLITLSEDGESKEELLNNVDPKPCIACIGILQKYTTAEFIEKVSKDVLDKGHEFESFICALSTPVPLIIREQSVWIALKDKFLCYKAVKKNPQECVIQTKEVWKWVCSHLLSKYLSAPFDIKSPFEISFSFQHPNINNECNFLTMLFPEVFQKRKNNRFGWEMFTRMNVTKALQKTDDTIFRSYCGWPPKVLTDYCICDDVICTHNPIYIAGRYNKYSRTLSQTPWFIDGEQKGESSVQELISEELIKKIKSSDSKFSSAGREDVDVKMLGTGRPFLLEFMNPKVVKLTQDEITYLQKAINSSTKSVQVRDLQMVAKEDTTILKEGETEKTKAYCALCWIKDKITQDKLDEALNSIKDLKLAQKTPIRVLHRRNLAVRERIVHSLSGKLINDHHFWLYLNTQAGTYIKEFVHGDFLRTMPSLETLLGAECDILTLDVQEVSLDWPKKIEET